MDVVLEQLKNGVRRFRKEVYPKHAAMYAQAANELQRPHTLFIACADSRVDPNEITSSGVGDVFVTRNIGNMVPAYGEMLGGVSAVVEFAVSFLGVRHIVVCGHSDCGAMKALLDPAAVASMPTVTSWMKNAHAALAVADKLYERDLEEGTGRTRIEELTEQNVLLQLQHLKTHPSVAGAMALGELTVSGWVYDIGSGSVRIAEDGQREFTPVETIQLEEGEGGSLEHEVILAAYRNFNARKIDEVLALVHENVDWSNGLAGGRIKGREALRKIWLLQWTSLDPTSEPIRIYKDEEGRTVVLVHQILRERGGLLLGEQQIEEVFTLRDGLIVRMDFRRVTQQEGGNVDIAPPRA